MYLKFIMMLIWVVALTVFVIILLKGLLDVDVNYIRIGFIGAIVSWCTMMAIYKDY